jgi:hypothetical protein
MKPLGLDSSKIKDLRFLGKNDVEFVLPASYHATFAQAFKRQDKVTFIEHYDHLSIDLLSSEKRASLSAAELRLLSAELYVKSMTALSKSDDVKPSVRGFYARLLRAKLAEWKEHCPELLASVQEKLDTRLPLDTIGLRPARSLLKPDILVEKPLLKEIQAPQTAETHTLIGPETTVIDPADASILDRVEEEVLDFTLEPEEDIDMLVNEDNDLDLPPPIATGKRILREPTSDDSFEDVFATPPRILSKRTTTLQKQASRNTTAPAAGKP